MIYAVAQRFARFLMKVFYRLRVEGLENFSAAGPLVVCANHTFIKDLIIIGSVAPRKIRWMAKIELFKFPPLGAFLRACGAFPVKRGAHDRDSIKKVYEVLDAGEPLGIFPEGTRTLDPNNRPPFKRGFVSFAANTGAAVLPAAIRYEDGPFGRGRLFSRVVLTFGNVRVLERGVKYGRAELEAISQSVMAWIHEKIVC